MPVTTRNTCQPAARPDCAVACRAACRRGPAAAGKASAVQWRRPGAIAMITFTYTFRLSRRSKMVNAISSYEQVVTCCQYVSCAEHLVNWQWPMPDPRDKTKTGASYSITKSYD
eukprot:6214570-Pleurochrysis_carterae.AAC.7